MSKHTLKTYDEIKEEMKASSRKRGPTAERLRAVSRLNSPPS